MPKINESTKNNQILKNEKRLEWLHEIVKSGHKNAGVSMSLISSFMDYQQWTYKQTELIDSLISGFSRDLKKSEYQSPVEKKYYLYALTCGGRVKIGHSSNIKKRIKSIQTANADEVELAWKFYVGTDRSIAETAERKLHRLCKKYLIRGEWFDIESMDMVVSYKPKLKSAYRAKLNRMRKKHVTGYRKRLAKTTKQN